MNAESIHKYPLIIFESFGNLIRDDKTIEK